MHHRHHTGIFGASLAAKSSLYQVFYDHGDPQNENVGAIQGFIGAAPTQTNILTNTDVMVVAPNGEILLLIEIEESELSPKKLIGDILVTAMCSNFSFGAGAAKQYFHVNQRTQAVIAGVVNPKGGKVDQLQNVILPRLKEFCFPSDSIPMDRFHFIVEGNIVCTMQSLQSLCDSLCDSLFV